MQGWRAGLSLEGPCIQGLRRRYDTVWDIVSSLDDEDDKVSESVSG